MTNPTIPLQYDVINVEYGRTLKISESGYSSRLKEGRVEPTLSIRYGSIMRRTRPSGLRRTRSIL